MTNRTVIVEPENFECVPHWLLLDTQISANALRVYLVLRKHRDYDTGESWPGLSRIGELCGGWSADTVRRQIRELEAVGAVCVHPRFDEHGGQTSNLYHVHFTQNTECEGPSNADSDPLAPMQGEALAPVTPKQRPISNKDPRNQVKTSAAALFDEFWKAYPRKKDKGHARKAWDKAAKTTDPAVIITAAVQFRQWCEQDGTEPEYTPYPATWLNGERWLDERDPQPRTNMQAHLAHIQELWETEPVDNPRQLEG